MIAASKQHCMLPGCDEPCHCRGLCHTDYTAAMRMVKDGRTTWAELEQRGIVLPPRTIYSAKSRVMVALEESRAATPAS